MTYTRLVIVTGISLSAFLVLALLAYHSPPLFFDLAVTRFLQQFRFDGLDWIMRDISWPGYYPQFLWMSGVMLTGLVLLKFRLEAVLMLISLIGVGIVGSGTKMFVNRPRPPDSLVWVNDHLEHGTYSFSAGHVYTYVVIYGWLLFISVYLLPRKFFLRVPLIIINIFILITIGIARVYLGDHWSSDVIGAYLLGISWIGVGLIGYKFLSERYEESYRRLNGKK